MHQKIYLCTYIFIQTVIFNFDPSGILKFNKFHSLRTYLQMEITKTYIFSEQIFLMITVLTFSIEKNVTVLFSKITFSISNVLF